jgi:hypothetical protein
MKLNINKKAKHAGKQLNKVAKSKDMKEAGDESLSSARVMPGIGDGIKTGDQINKGCK